MLICELQWRWWADFVVSGQSQGNCFQSLSFMQVFIGYLYLIKYQVHFKLCLDMFYKRSFNLGDLQVESDLPKRSHSLS